MTALEQILSDSRYAAFLALHGGSLSVAGSHVRDAAIRLKLPPLARMTVGEMEEATTCVGCVATLARDTRVIAGHPSCPAHGSSS